MTGEELIELGNKPTKSRETEEEKDKLYELFSNNAPHPSGANLFYYPENYNANKFDISTYDPTVEEVVDLALSYKPIILP